MYTSIGEHGKPNSVFFNRFPLSIRQCYFSSSSSSALHLSGSKLRSNFLPLLVPPFSILAPFSFGSSLLRIYSLRRVLSRARDSRRATDWNLEFRGKREKYFFPPAPIFFLGKLRMEFFFSVRIRNGGSLK